MKSITQTDRKRAEALRSLSLDPPPQAAVPHKLGPWRLSRPSGVFAMVVVLVFGAIFIHSNGLQTVKALAKGLMPSEPSAGSTDASTLKRKDETARRDEQTVPDQPAPVATEIAGSGYVVATRRTTVFSKYEGRVIDIAVDLGDQVKARQPLVELDNADAQFALERAKAAKLQARQLLTARRLEQTQARAVFERNQTLAAQGAIARQGLEASELAARLAVNAVALAEQDVANAELAIRIAKEAVAELNVRAPFAGTVTRLDAHVGDTVLARADTARDGQSLLTITDMSSLVIDADVAEVNASLLRAGLRGEATLDGFADRPFAVQVLRLAPTASADKGTIALRLSITDPPTGIRPHMAARVRIALTTDTFGATTP
jgi:RND family efflux transporter MFP subunit